MGSPRRRVAGSLADGQLQVVAEIAREDPAVTSTVVDDERFRATAEPYRRELFVHCYRMLGSVDDAHDVVQEVLTRSWRAFGRYDPALASMRTWLYRIATNACLSARTARERRPLPADVGPMFDDPDAAFAPALEVPGCSRSPPLHSGAATSIPPISRSSGLAFGWRSLRRSSSCRRDNAPRCCSVKSWTSRRRRSPSCST
jgi:hypothetical protein